MKMLKRFTNVAVTACVLGMILTGCGAGNGSGDTAATNDTHYNEMIDIKDYPNLDMENSEHIVDYEYQYQYCLNISFNEDGTAGRGSAIFLHCFGPLKPYTGGCVAVPENIMKLIMQNVDEDCVVVIDTFENMGGSF